MRSPAVCARQAEPKQIAALLAAMSSDTVDAPRTQVLAKYGDGFGGISSQPETLLMHIYTKSTED